MLENMLDYARIALYSLLIILGFLLFQAWQEEHPTKTFEQVSVAQTNPLETLPQVSQAEQSLSPTTPTPITQPPPAAQKGQMVSVRTDLYEVQIDTQGGDIVSAKLLKFPESLNAKTPYILLNDDPKTRYLAESGLLSHFGPDTANQQAIYSSPQTHYEMSQVDNNLDVSLTWQKDNVTVTKTFSFTKGDYIVHVKYDIDNRSTQPWTGNFYAQLIRTNNPPTNHGGMVNLTTFFGAAISSPEKPFEKITFKDMQEKTINQRVTGGWAAMVQHYFISAWVPASNVQSTYYTRVFPNGLYGVGVLGPQITVEPGTKAQTQAKLYTGPASASELEKAAPGLKLTIDYGWFWFISDIIFWMMQKIYEFVGNWGWSIVLVTVVIKLLFYQLSAKSYRSMSALKKLQPRMEMLKERYGDDKQKLTQATLELYKQEKVNPMSGCLPVLIQIPVFIALYWVLVESVELRQAPFILWIHDLSQPDPYYILPILVGVSMFLQQRLNPPPPDPLQAKVMMMMPIIFTVLFANFPSGLMLYWFVNTVLSYLQQWFIMYRMGHMVKSKR